MSMRMISDELLAEAQSKPFKRFVVASGEGVRWVLWKDRRGSLHLTRASKQATLPLQEAPKIGAGAENPL